MTEKEFVVDNTTYTVSISHFQGPVPGKYHAAPEDCYEDEPAEVEFESKVEYATDDDNEVKTMDFCDFLRIYAAEHTEGDTDKAESRIECDTITEILEQADEYEP